MLLGRILRRVKTPVSITVATAGTLNRGEGGGFRVLKGSALLCRDRFETKTRGTDLVCSVSISRGHDHFRRLLSRPPTVIARLHGGQTK